MLKIWELCTHVNNVGAMYTSKQCVSYTRTLTMCELCTHVKHLGAMYTC